MIALKNILVATDFGAAADTAVTYARELAHAFDATLHVLHVTDDVRLAVGSDFYVAMTPLTQQEVDGTARKYLDTLAADDRDETGEQLRTAIRTSTRPAHAIVAYAGEERIDLIVIGTHGRGALEHLLLGSVAEPVIRMAPCPVLTVRHPEHEFVVADTSAAGVRAVRLTA